MTWLAVSDGDARLLGHYLAHYSSKKARENTPAPYYGAERLVIGPGEKMALLTLDNSAAFTWRRAKFRQDGQSGIECTMFRNTTGHGCKNQRHAHNSAHLIRAACALAWEAWPTERLFTYVDPREVASANPGYCFKLAGWAVVRDPAGKPMRTSRGLVVLEVWP